MLSLPIPPQPQLLRSIKHVFMCNECYHFPSHPNPNCCVASNMCSCATNVITPHPTPTPTVASHQTCVHVQRMLSHPIPPQPELFCSIKHVFMCNECYHFPSHPNPNCCVASNMCSCATNVITSHPNANCCVASNMCSCATNVITSHPTPTPTVV